MAAAYRDAIRTVEDVARAAARPVAQGRERGRLRVLRGRAATSRSRCSSCAAAWSRTGGSSSSRSPKRSSPRRSSRRFCPSSTTSTRSCPRRSTFPVADRGPGAPRGVPPRAAGRRGSPCGFPSGRRPHDRVALAEDERPGAPPGPVPAAGRRGRPRGRAAGAGRSACPCRRAGSRPSTSRTCRAPTASPRSSSSRTAGPRSRTTGCSESPRSSLLAPGRLSQHGRGGRAPLPAAARRRRRDARISSSWMAAADSSRPR